MAGTSALATSLQAHASSISHLREAVRQSLQEAFPSLPGTFPSLSGNSGKRKSDFKSKKGTGSKAPALTKKTCNVVYKDLILLPEPDTKTVPPHRLRITLENDGFVVHEFQSIAHVKKRNLKRK